MKKLTQKEIELLKNLATDRRGQKRIDEFIWLNTTQAKYKKGQKVLVTDRGHRIYGVEVVDFIGTVKAVRYSANGDEHNINYEIDCKAQKKGNNKIYEFTVFVIEHDWTIKPTKKRNDLNIIQATSEDTETIALSF